MTLTTAQHCVSGDPYFQFFLQSDSDPTVVYSVSVPYPGAPEEEYVCTCKGFAYRGMCKHVHRVELCLWDEFEGPEIQTDEERKEGICPRCGNLTTKELVDDRT